MSKVSIKKILLMIFPVLFCAALFFSSVTKKNSGVAYAEAKGPSVDLVSDSALDFVSGDTVAPSDEVLVESSEDLSVQVILTASRSAVISGTMDGVLIKLPFENGDKFKKGDTLAEYNCQLERGKVEEIKARIRLSDRQLKAYERLREMEAVAEIEYLSVEEANRQEKALLKQARARSALCVIKAPFDGRVKDKASSNYEAVKSGRVLMEVSASEPLHAELLVPSVWLRWLNVGSDLEIHVHESGKTYDAKVIRVHGEVDPVTQTAHVVAQIDGYKEELLPGMSGRAKFIKPVKNKRAGFLGLNLGDQ